MTAHFNVRAAVSDTAGLPPVSAPALSPAEDRDLRLVAAVRLFDQGEMAPALRDLEALLAEQSDWVEGHVVMAQLLSQSGDAGAVRDFLSWTVRRARGDLSLVVACLRQLSDAEHHEAIEQLVPEVRRWAGDHLFFTLLEAVAASELGNLARAEVLFAAAASDGGVLSLPHVRHLIRTGDALKAATIAEAFLREQPRHQGAWGLLETAWRLTGDTRHGWLVQPGLVDTLDVMLTDEALAALAQCLRRLHRARSHPFDQSLRGGTQTAGSLFRHRDAELREPRRALIDAVRRYLAALPPHDAAHPLLGQDRSSFHMSDNWSVRLLDGGFHLSHVHPRGTLSSAFYVTLPAMESDQQHSGWLTIGEPPESLRTGLPPLCVIEPKVGRLALFPSFLWHGTRPFPQGERMTIAFDTVLGE